ncbi:hypothetical protein Ancab_005402 [Ancistrocladus abbreviatus]
MAPTNQFCHFICLLVLFGVGLFASQASSSLPLSSEPSMIERYHQWMAQYNRVYKDEVEKERHFEIFKENVERIETLNKMNRGFTIGLNSFSDLTNEEIRASRTGYKPTSPKSSMPFRYGKTTDVPASMDWRDRGAVTPIKDQGSCGSCWAFTTVATVEGVHQITTGDLVSLSEQELVDCDTTNNGCNGGNMDSAFQFIMDNNGLTTEANYPYTGSQGTCNTQATTPAAATINGYENVPANNEGALLLAVANQPVAIAIDASGQDFQQYSGGVYTGEECGTKLTIADLDHAVTVIGYGTTDDGTKYWLIKNSWGTSWGENGYMKMKRDVDYAIGVCGLAMQPSYPTA